MRAPLMAVFIVVIAATLSATEPALPPGHDRYIVVLQPGVTFMGATVEEVGGKLELDLGDRLIITASRAAIDKLREHAAVRYAQKAVIASTATPDVPDIRTTSMHPPVRSDSGLTWTSGDYSYDGAGNISAIGTAAAPGTQGHRTYGYDSLTRLTKAEIGVTPSVTHEYSYDVYGNRTQDTIDSQSVTVPVSSTTNRLTNATYDASGNQTALGATVATYDGFDMVTSYRFDGVNVETFVYTASDERIGVLRGTDWTWSLRDTSGQVLRQYRSSSTNPNAPWLWIEDYVYRDGLLLGSERVAEEGGRRHYHLDHLGSARLVTGASGSVISEHDYLPFGAERTMIGQHLARGFDREEPMRFTGHERDFDNTTPNDSSAYIDYMHALYYAANSVRFLSPDPVLGNLLQPQSWNRYAYVLNNPVNLIDPSGLQAVVTVTAKDPATEWLEREQRWYEFDQAHAWLRLWNPIRSTFLWADAHTIERVNEHFNANPVVIDPIENPMQLVELGALISPIPGDELIVASQFRKAILKNTGRWLSDLPGGKAAAKSILRHLSKGKIVREERVAGMVRRYVADGSVQIRFMPTGQIRLDIKLANGLFRTIHF